MRVNPNPMPDLLAALNRTRLDAQQAMLQISSGQSVNQPSDNPAAAALLIDNHDQTTFANGYLQSLNSIEGQLSTADSSLSPVVTALQQALSLGVEGANGTLNDADRSAIATELQGIQDQLVSLANTSFQGRYLFSGTVTNTPPFVADISVPSGVRYDGNDTVNQVAIGNGYQLAVNQPGSQLFVAPGHDMFQAMTNLILAMKSNFGFDAAIASVRDAYDYISTQRVFYGNALNQAQSQTTYLNTAKLQLSQQQNTLGGADLAAAAARLTNAETATNATLSAMARFSQMNLFDFLK
jgi:flagellar hook-associated protein 3 FlgL